MGLRTLFSRLFTGSTQVSEHPSDALIALVKQVAHLNERIEALEDAQAADRASVRRQFGRVYAWKRFDPVEDDATPPEKPQEKPLTDPTLTKQELRARLLKPGKPFKHN